MSRMENFILDCAEADTYPEPRCDLHDRITAEMAEAVSKLLPVGGKLLDIGCGQGPALQWFTEHGFDVRGITLNKEDAEVCREKGFAVTFADQNDLGLFHAEYCDLVWARHVLEHSIAPFWTLREFNRVLKPGGICYIEVPAPDTTCDHCNNVNHYSVFGWRMWASLITRAGFDILEARQFDFEVKNLGADLYFMFTTKKKASQ